MRRQDRLADHYGVVYKGNVWSAAAHSMEDMTAMMRWGSRSVEWWEIACRGSLEASRRRRYHQPNRLKLAVAYFVLGACVAALFVSLAYLPV